MAGSLRWTNTSAGSPAPEEQSSIFTLSLLFPDVTAPVQSCPCVTMGKPAPRRRAMLTCARLQCHVPSYPEAKSCDADGPLQLSTAPRALPQAPTAGNGSITRAHGSKAGCRDSPRGRQVLGKGHTIASSHLSSSILEECWPSLATSHFSPSTS